SGRERLFHHKQSEQTSTSDCLLQYLQRMPPIFSKAFSHKSQSCFGFVSKNIFSQLISWMITCSHHKQYISENHPFYSSQQWLRPPPPSPLFFRHERKSLRQSDPQGFFLLFRKFAQVLLHRTQHDRR